MIVLVGVCIEAVAFATRYLTHDLYDHRDATLELIEPATLEQFRARAADPVLGWDQRGPARQEQANCLGVPVAYQVDADGARVYPGYAGEDARVVVVGDSYTHGDEVPGEESYPAQLALLLHAPVANQGVGGYGPTQSLLRLERVLERYPEARVVVLGIMYENLYRMVNSYRPVLYDNTPYGFKPYMAGGRLVPHPGADALADVAAVRLHAERAFDRDFWARPRHRFPYTFSLLRALRTPFFRFRKVEKRLRSLGVPEYFLTYRSQDFRRELLALLDLYAGFADARGVVPVVVFIPRNRHDTVSASRWIAANRQGLSPALVVGDVGRADVDWERFNLENVEEDNICHPSAYGYRKIAEFVARLLRAHGFPDARRAPVAREEEAAA